MLKSVDVSSPELFISVHLIQLIFASASPCYDMEEAEAKQAQGEKTQPFHAEASWRELSINDIKSLARIADTIHPGLPEDDEVFSERVSLFPEGCLALLDSNSNDLYGYTISHPIRRRQPPSLNSLLGKIDSEHADQYYIHDLAILPELRGRGFAQECMNKLFAIAKRYPTTCLISVYGTETFWGRFGFVKVGIDKFLREKLLGYGDDAVYLERKNEGYQRQATTDGGTV